MRHPRIYNLFIGSISLLLPGVGQAIIGYPWQGVAINLAWKLFTLSILLPAIGIKFYLLAGIGLLMGIAAYTWLTARKSNPPGIRRVGVCLCLFLLLEGGEIYFIRSQVMKYYRIHDISMEPTLLDGDLVLLDRVSSFFKPYNKDEVIIFSPPKGGRDLVKRIANIVVPQLIGDMIPQSIGELHKGERELFVLGDNRNHSLDSRAFGAIPDNRVFGKVCRIVWSFDSVNKRIRWERIGLPIPPAPVFN